MNLIIYHFQFWLLNIIIDQNRLILLTITWLCICERMSSWTCAKRCCGVCPCQVWDLSGRVAGSRKLRKRDSKSLHSHAELSLWPTLRWCTGNPCQQFPVILQQCIVFCRPELRCYSRIRPFGEVGPRLVRVQLCRVIPVQIQENRCRHFPELEEMIGNYLQSRNIRFFITFLGISIRYPIFIVIWYWIIHCVVRYVWPVRFR